MENNYPVETDTAVTKADIAQIHKFATQAMEKARTEVCKNRGVSRSELSMRDYGDILMLALSYAPEYFPSSCEAETGMREEKSCKPQKSQQCVDSSVKPGL
ncbi:MAG: hypothetical protein PHE27_02565 [Alphaproteobacteria bacterium]|nr:hypothetical protein [Alphaproteobacteria bacterium]